MTHPDQIEDLAPHTQTREFRIFGPPGTGKTTSLSRQVRRAVDKFGSGSVMVTSFSRTAAAELAGRDLPIEPRNIGTLHAHCYRALDFPRIAEANVQQWNEDNPELQITPSKKEAALEGEETGSDDDSRAPYGDQMLEATGRLRGLLTPVDVWPIEIQRFWKKWSEYKAANDLLDFTDLVETAYRDVYMAPGRPSVIMADEAQDLNRLQMGLVRRWGERAEYFIMSGDDDQLLYSWTGCTPDALLEPELPPEQIIVLKQSYRVPRAVHHRANSLIQTVTRRQSKEYLPRPIDGLVETLQHGDWRHPGALLRLAEEHLENGQRVMFLTACSYQLNGVMQMLRNAGWPYHNPYRKTNGAWNPIRIGGRGTVSNRILALLTAQASAADGAARTWTWAEVALWGEWLAAEGVLKRGQKKLLTGEVDNEKTITIEDLDRIFTLNALESLLDAFGGSKESLLEWWIERLPDQFRKRAAFPAAAVRRHGLDALVEQPPVVVGTIHSVKGGEAEVVFLFPDLSPQGAMAYRAPGVHRDSVVRQFYVGMTRAREVLYICPPAVPDLRISV